MRICRRLIFWGVAIALAFAHPVLMLAAVAGAAGTALWFIWKLASAARTQQPKTRTFEYKVVNRPPPVWQR